MSYDHDLKTGLMCHVKRPAENVHYSFDYSKMIEPNDYIVSIVAVTQVNRHEADVIDPITDVVITPSTDLTIGATSIEDEYFGRVFISDGQAGETYVVEMIVNTDGGETRAVCGVVIVKDC